MKLYVFIVCMVGFLKKIEFLLHIYESWILENLPFLFQII